MKFGFKAVLSMSFMFSQLLLVSCSKNNQSPNTSKTNVGNNGGGAGIVSGSVITGAVVSTVTGTLDVMGFQNAGPLYATFNSPSSIAVDAYGNVFVTDTWNHLIREISAKGIVSTFAGTGHSGNTDGPGSSAAFNSPEGIAIDSKGNLFIADKDNNLIRKITPSGTVSTFAGTGNPGSQDGLNNLATFSGPYAVAIDKNDNIFVSDINTNLLRKIDTLGNVMTIAGTGSLGSQDGVGKSASFAKSVAMAFDAAGNLYIIDQAAASIRKMTPNLTVTTMYQLGNTYTLIGGIAIDSSGNIYVSCSLGIIKISPNGLITGLVAGTFYTTDRDIVTHDRLYNPEGLAIYGNGNLLVADNVNNMIREVNSSGGVTNFAGSGNQGSTNGLAVEFNYPSDLAVDKSGNIFVADFGNRSIREVFPNGSVNTFQYQNGISLGSPAGIKLDNAGNLFVADRQNNVILKLAPSGTVSSFAGNGTAGAVNGSVATASFYQPNSIAIDAAGNVYVADEGNKLIRKISTSGIVTTLAGNGKQGNVDGPGNSASFGDPICITIDNQGNILVADAVYHTIRKVTPAGVVSTIVLKTSNGVGFPMIFDVILGLAVDAFGNIFVSDVDNTYGSQVSHIRVVSPSGVGTILAGGSSGWADGPGASARFNTPYGLAIDSDGNLLVADQFNQLIRKITITRQ